MRRVLSIPQSTQLLSFFRISSWTKLTFLAVRLVTIVAPSALHALTRGSVVFRTDGSRAMPLPSNANASSCTTGFSAGGAPRVDRVERLDILSENEWKLLERFEFPFSHFIRFSILYNNMQQCIYTKVTNTMSWLSDVSISQIHDTKRVTQHLRSPPSLIPRLFRTTFD
jgi:hypothetical protein